MKKRNPLVTKDKWRRGIKMLSEVEDLKKELDELIYEADGVTFRDNIEDSSGEIIKLDEKVKDLQDKRFNFLYKKDT